jgi:hypothetical protein
MPTFHENGLGHGHGHNVGLYCLQSGGSDNMLSPLSLITDSGQVPTYPNWCDLERRLLSFALPAFFSSDINYVSHYFSKSKVYYFFFHHDKAMFFCIFLSMLQQRLQFFSIPFAVAAFIHSFVRDQCSVVPYLMSCPP